MWYFVQAQYLEKLALFAQCKAWPFLNHQQDVERGHSPDLLRP